MISLNFIRHATTDLNGKGYVATKEDFPLNENGIAECEKITFSEGYFDLVYSSPYKRTIQTAKIIYPYIEPIITSLITQRDLGDLNEHFKWEYTKEYLNQVRNYITNPSNAESLDKIINRLNIFFDLVRTECQDDSRVLIVTHNGIMRIIKKNFAIEQEYVDSANLGGFILKMEKKDGKIRR